MSSSQTNGEVSPGSEDNLFDLETVQKHFTTCLIDNEDIVIDGYLNAYKELKK